MSDQNLSEEVRPQCSLLVHTTVRVTFDSHGDWQQGARYMEKSNTLTGEDLNSCQRGQPAVAPGTSPPQNPLTCFRHQPLSERLDSCAWSATPATAPKPCQPGSAWELLQVFHWIVTYLSVPLSQTALHDA